MDGTGRNPLVSEGDASQVSQMMKEIDTEDANSWLSDIKARAAMYRKSVG